MEGLNGVIFVESAALLSVHPAQPRRSRSRNIDSAMEESAQNLGASGFRLFRRIVFPLALPGYVAGAALVFVKVFDDLGTPLVLNVTNMLAPQAYLRITSIGIEDPIGYVISVIMVVFSIAALWRLGAGSLQRPRLRDAAARRRARAAAHAHAAGRRCSPTAGSCWCCCWCCRRTSACCCCRSRKVWSFTVMPEAYTLANYATVFTDSPRMIWNTLRLLRARRRPRRRARHRDRLPDAAHQGCPAASCSTHLATAALAIPGVVLGIGYLRTFRGFELPFTDSAVHGELAGDRARLRGAAAALRAALVRGGAAAGARRRWRRRRRTSARPGGAPSAASSCR